MAKNIEYLIFNFKKLILLNSKYIFYGKNIK